ncbi:MAG TPA: YggS family pyridoxal phosphate-dependent enzyme [Thermoanaerobaculia bacterium]|nr:YggS family pyridoxal phosphate-dependent enzyme [Thermoanaerobaculia bacterium]
MISAEAVARNVLQIRERIADASRRAHRSPDSVALIAVSKGHPPEAATAAYQAGVATLGENRVQEAAAKRSVCPEGIEWHLLGPLQSNKVNLAVETFSAIHSLDRMKVARLLERRLEERGESMPAWIEVLLGNEESKHGFSPRGLVEQVAPLAELRHLRVVGLMTVPPYRDEPEEVRPFFQRLRALRDDLFARPAWSDRPGYLSMGMSHDFEVAIEEGATHVRVGTAIFGARAR